MEIKKHFGVYAVCLENGKLLCIEKMRGPYQHLTTSEAVSDGANDSLGYIWMDIQEITEENASPLVFKVKSELLGFPELDKTSYMNWKVNDEKSTCP